MSIGSDRANGAWLQGYSRNEFSQAGEDGIIEKILDVLPAANDPWCVEFGAWDGEHLSNTAALIQHKNYSAVLIEPNASRFEKLRLRYAQNRKVHCQRGYVRCVPPDSLDERLSRTPIPEDFDLLSVDIDGNDYHVWSASSRYRPRIVVIEFNPTIPDEVDFVQPNTGSVQQGCSVAALYRLGREKGYEPVCVTRNNALFVRDEYFPMFGIRDNSIAALRRDRELVTHIFFGYDGAVLLAGHRRIPWHQVPLCTAWIQHLPKSLRRYPDDYNPIQRFCYRVLRKGWATIVGRR